MPEDEEVIDHEGLDPRIREALRAGTQASKDKAAAEQRAAALERELAFTKAGVPDSPLTQTLAKTYDGENDPTAIKAYFDSLGVDITGASAGVATQQSPAPQQGASEAELAAQRQLAQATASGDLGGDVDFADALGSAKSPDEIQRLLDSAPAEARVMNKVLE